MFGGDATHDNGENLFTNIVTVGVSETPDKGPNPKAKERFTLHNLAEENPEVKDYAKQEPEKVKQLLEMHARWEKDVFSK